MRGFNTLYEKLIDLGDYQRLQENLSYVTGTLADLQYSFNTTTRFATLNKTSATSRSGFTVLFKNLKKGDVLDVTFEVYNTGNARIKAQTHEMGRGAKVTFSSNVGDDYETVTFKHLKRWDGNLELFLGFLEVDTGQGAIRNVSIKVDTVIKIDNYDENIKTYMICKQPNGLFELRSDFASSPGTLTFPDATTLQINFANNFPNKRPVVDVNTSGYGQGNKYKAKAYDVQKNLLSIKLYDKSDVAVDISAIPTAEYIFINVWAKDLPTALL